MKRLLSATILTLLVLPAAGCAVSGEIPKLRRLVKEGDAHAQFVLAINYHSGCPVLGGKKRCPENHPEEMKLLWLAAEQGHANAMEMLGDRYYRGLDVPWDLTEAAKWYRLAAEHGDASAQTRLGDMLRKSEGVPSDYVQAYMWYSLAAESTAEYKGGFTPAIGKRDALAERMAPSQIGEAERLAREWQKAHPR